MDQPAVIDLSFTAQALRLSEMIRLKADDGGFQREGTKILYKPETVGDHTLTLEAFCGFKWDGTVDFAERRKITIHVAEADAPAGDHKKPAETKN